MVVASQGRLLYTPRHAVPDLNVAFWNVNNLFEPRHDDPRAPASVGERDAKVARIAQVLKSLFGGEGPDLVGLAEIHSDGIVKELARQLAMPLLVWQPCRNSDYALTGLAILARKERFASLDLVTQYPQSSFCRPRYIVVRCVLAERSEPFFFVVNHWRSKIPVGQSKAAEAETDRRHTAQALATWLAENGADTCAIVVGDFNAQPFEAPFGKGDLAATRYFRPLVYPRLDNTAWRFLTEPDYCEVAVAHGKEYRASRARTTLDYYDKERPVSVVFDQLLVTARAIAGGPIMLQEGTVDYAFDDIIGHHLPDGDRRPRRWSFIGGVARGASDHFPLTAKFLVRIEASHGQGRAEEEGRGAAEGRGGR